MDFGPHDPHLNEQVAFAVRLGTYGSFQVQAEHLDGVSKLQIRRFQISGFFRLFCFCLFLVQAVHLFTERSSFLLHFADGNAFFSEFLEIAHGLIGVILGIAQNSFGFFGGLGNDLIPPFVETFPLFCQTAFQFFYFFPGNGAVLPVPFPL